MINDTNPNHYKVEGANFIEYMNDPKISGFGNWMFANGFNSGVWASTNWISVKDRLPERPDWYLVYAPEYNGGSSRQKEKHKGVMFSKWNGKSWGIEKGYYDKPNIVIAWRKIPEPPEVEQNEET